MIKNLYLLFLCILFSSTLMGMKKTFKPKQKNINIIAKNSIAPKKFGNNVFAYKRIENNVHHFNKLRTVESRFMDKDGKLWQNVINIKGTYDTVPVIVDKNGEWVPEKQGKIAATWNYFKKFLGIKTENPNQVRTPPFGYFSHRLHGEQKVYPKHSQFPPMNTR